MLADTETISLLPDLDRASDTRKANLCRTWKNAEENDCGVLTINTKEFEAREKNRFAPMVRITCALVYPNVYYNFDVMASESGHASPCDRQYSPKFDVHECAPNVMLMVEHHLRDYVKGFGINEKFIESVLQQMRKSIEEVA